MKTPFPFPLPMGPARLFLAAAAFAWLAPSPAFSAHVVYYHAFGEWAVTCWGGEGKRPPGCSLTAPAASMTAAAPRSTLTASETADGVFALGVRASATVLQSAPLTLKIDGGKAYQGMVNRFGEAAWTGKAATDLLNEMIRGRGLSIRFINAGTESPLLDVISLEGLGQAMTAYRSKLRELGVFK